MGLLDDLKPPVKLAPCKVRDTAATLEKKDGDILLAATKDPLWAVSTLEGALKSRGLSISSNAIKAHRLNKCSCRFL